MAVANKYTGEPIVFIAVNSGNSVSDVRKYLSSNHVTWPTIVDANRNFENACGVGEISLKNIWSFAVVNAEGQLQRVGNDAEANAEKALTGAKWNVDPQLIPTTLQTTWRAVEFGNYAAAARTLKKSLSSSNEQIKTGAETLNAYVQQQLNQQLATAAEAREADNPWLAYKAYAMIAQQFKGFDFDVDVDAALAELKKDELVDQELDAQRLLSRAVKQIAKSGVQRVSGRLKKIVEDYPATEAGQTAQAILEGQN